MSDYLEDMLSPENRVRFELHLSGCEGCQDFLEPIRTTAAALSGLKPDDVPKEVMEEFLRRFRDWNKSL